MNDFIFFRNVSFVPNTDEMNSNDVLIDFSKNSTPAVLFFVQFFLSFREKIQKPLRIKRSVIFTAPSTCQHIYMETLVLAGNGSWEKLHSLESPQHKPVHTESQCRSGRSALGARLQASSQPRSKKASDWTQGRRRSPSQHAATQPAHPRLDEDAREVRRAAGSLAVRNTSVAESAPAPTVGEELHRRGWRWVTADNRARTQQAEERGTSAAPGWIFMQVFDFDSNLHFNKENEKREAAYLSADITFMHLSSGRRHRRC